LGIGTTGLLFGGDWPTFGHNGINFTYCPFVPDSAAVTFGNAMLYGPGNGHQSGSSKNCPPGSGTGTEALIKPGLTIGSHEEQHTYQGEVLGPAYIPLNILDKLIWGFYDGPLEKPAYSIPPKPW
jgi:hypothetical protein